MIETQNDKAQSREDASEQSTTEANKSTQTMDPSKVPYVNNYYTYADRKRDLNLMLLLIDDKRAEIVEELGFVQQCCATRTYPNINCIDGSLEG